MKKDIKFSTRMASADREKIRALAQKAGMSMSDYVTACCLGKRIVVMDGLKEVLRQQKAIGNNLNQIAAKAHTLNALDVQRYDENCRKLDDAVKTITAAVILPRPMK